MTISSKEVHAIDVEINQLQQQLELLQAKRRELSDLAEQHRALLSPVRRLSRDVLEAIFLACLPTDRNPCMSATEAPILLTRISSSWRNIAHSTPRLWAAIHISFPSVDNHSYPYTARSYLTVREAQLHLKLKLLEAGIKEWLERTGACPLSISIYQSHNWGQPMISHRPLAGPAYGNLIDKYRELYSSFIRNTIVPYIKRWHDIDIGPDGLTAKFTTMLKNVHIGVNTTAVQNIELVKHWKEIVGLLPSQVITAAISELHPVDNIPVNLCAFSSVVLCHCLALKILKLIVAPVHPNRSNNISLHHLVILSLSLSSLTDTMEFVKHLYLPSIQQIDFECIQVEDILKMALRASGGGVSLGLYRPYWILSSAQLLDILQNIPYLTSLVISSANIMHDKRSTPYWFQPSSFHVLNDDLMSAMSPAGKEYSEIICPQLEVLECDSKLMTGLTEEGLKNFRIAPLRKLCISINDYKQEVPVDEEVSLGDDSAVYFRKCEDYSLSPWMGLEVQTDKSLQTFHPEQVMYTKL
ncbi:hypothetical protein BDQ17DRAFT_1358239 [Cyathus striatus]|nr:hypothetical protein BDQ17DRAFT_1358239 [Cyathus striatus]